MTAAALDFRLTHGLDDGGLAALAAAWRHDDIAVALAGMAGFAGSPSLLNKVRGALGTVLLAAASPGVLQRRGCDWPQTCAAEVFFGRRRLYRIAGHDSELTKPFVLSAAPDGQDLVIGMRIFGIATDWTAAVSEALVTALRRHVNWALLARDGAWRVPPIVTVVAVTRQVACRPVPIDSLPDRVDVVFRTATDSERGGSGLPALMARRLALVAPWQRVAAGTVHDDSERALAIAAWREGDPSSVAVPARGGHRMHGQLAIPPAMSIDRPTLGVLTVLHLVTLCNIGRGASLGLGRFACLDAKS